MIEGLATHWWAIALRGIAGIIFGVLALVWPLTAFAALVLLFGAYALVDGIFNLIAGIRSGFSGERWGSLIFSGVVGILAGLVTMFWPGITALWLVLVVAAWALVTGVLEIVAAFRLRKAIAGEWLLGLSGLLSIALGVMLFLYPGVGAVLLPIWIGAYALLYGTLTVWLGFRLRPFAARPAAPRPVAHST